MQNKDLDIIMEEEKKEELKYDLVPKTSKKVK